MGEILALPKIVFHINEEVRIQRMNLRVVLVEPMYDGNIGSVARSMKNFGFGQLVLVNPCKIEDYGMALDRRAGILRGEC